MAATRFVGSSWRWAALSVALGGSGCFIKTIFATEGLPCNTNANCPESQVCCDGDCAASCSHAGSCASDDDCRGPFGCGEGICRKICLSPDACEDDFACNPDLATSGLCVPQIVIGCSDPAAVCPTDINDGDPCEVPGSFINCSPSFSDCTAGCRTCNKNGQWSACSAVRCDLDAVASCGACDVDCFANLANVTTELCTDQQCDYNTCIAAPPKFVDADGDRTNGCECEFIDTFDIPCNGIDEDCDGADAPESDTDTNCIACGDDCTALPNVMTGVCNVACPNNSCLITACKAGFGDVDFDPTNGCECSETNGGVDIECNGIDEDCDGVDMHVTPTLTACSSCTDDCTALPNIKLAAATPTCPVATCMFECLTGFSNADGIPTNGCECDPSATGTDQNCKKCGDDCNSRDNVAVGTCDTSGTPTCAITTCATGFGDANGNAADGCECCMTNGGVEIPCNGDDEDCDGVAATESGTDRNCSGCGDNCLSGVLNADGFCSGSSTCDYTACTTVDFVDLDGVRTNGCECVIMNSGVDIPCNSIDENCDGADATESGTLQNCSGCGNNCLTAVLNADGFCNGTMCDYNTCVGLFTDADGDRTNGCEMPL